MPDLADPWQDLTLQERQTRVIAEFDDLDGMDTYLHLIAGAQAVPDWDEAEKTEEHLVPGCQSEVWLRAEERDGRLWFYVDSPSRITKGIAVLLSRVLSGSVPAEIAGAELSFVQEIGLADHLSPDKANGLHAMLKRMRAIAEASA